MRLDHLLSRETTRQETAEFIPRSILTRKSERTEKLVKEEPLGSKRIVVQTTAFSISFSGFEREGAAHLDNCI